MTRKEARKILQKLATNSLCVEDYSNDKIKISSRMGAQALRPVSREQVEKVWRGEWIIQQDEHREFIKKCPKCGFPISGWWGADKFCANCGEAFTDEAVDIVMERLEALNNV